MFVHTDLYKDKLRIGSCHGAKDGGARGSLQSSAFLSGKCMARDVFTFSAAVRGALVAGADALRSRSALL